MKRLKLANLRLIILNAVTSPSTNVHGIVIVQIYSLRLQSCVEDCRKR